MPAISVLIKPASGLCNMHCDYCFYKDEMENRTDASFGFMTEETLKNVIRKTLLRAEGVASYAFQGGEPSLRGLDFFKKAVELQKKYNKNNVRVNNAFQTNGTLIDEVASMMGYSNAASWAREYREFLADENARKLP